jgi:hypothetical protein
VARADLTLANANGFTIWGYFGRLLYEISPLEDEASPAMVLLQAMLLKLHPRQI